VRREGHTLRCVSGPWSGKPKLTVRWWRRGTPGGAMRFVAGTKTTRPDKPGALGCSVTARTAGGWATEGSYNQL
jgi:hypothetical protein